MPPNVAANYFKRATVGEAMADFNADMTKAAKRAQGWYVSPALPTIT
jgi:hypothetical protein